jgi:hypothetical protein
MYHKPLRTLSARPLALQEIAIRSGVPYGSARVLDARMVQQGLITSAARGAYTPAGTTQSGTFSRIACAASCGNAAPGRA